MPDRQRNHPDPRQRTRCTHRLIVQALIFIMGLLWIMPVHADAIPKTLRGQTDPHKAKVGDLMSSPILTIDRKEMVGRATVTMEEKVIRHLAVTDHGKIVGMLSVKDLEKFYYKMHQKTNF